ncbi:MAG: hypothetical protein WBQ25_06770 [Nitrososphaeraceae archaeon]
MVFATSVSPDHAPYGNSSTSANTTSGSLLGGSNTTNETNSRLYYKRY